MMHKAELREKLAQMPEDAVTLAFAMAETSFFDVERLQQCRETKAVLFLLEWTAIEALALLSQLDPLTCALMLRYVAELVASPKELKRVGIRPERVKQVRAALRKLVELASQFKV